MEAVVEFKKREREPQDDSESQVVGKSKKRGKITRKVDCSESSVIEKKKKRDGEREPEESSVIEKKKKKKRKRDGEKEPDESSVIEKIKAEATRAAIKTTDPLKKRKVLGTRICDLPPKLVGKKILRRIPITSLRQVRSTCKLWNSLSRENWIVGKAAARQQFLGFMTMDFKVCSLRFDLLKDKDKDKGDRGKVDVSVKQVALLDQVEISKVFHCKGLLLCVPKDNSSLVAWNPYLGQTRWIKPRESFDVTDRYALGYDKKSRSHKILRFLDGGHPSYFDYKFGYELYDFSSDSWRVLDIIPHWDVLFYQRCASLKGDSYFFAQEKIVGDADGCGQVVCEYENFLICFDFTSERFGPRLALPFHSYIDETVTLSCVGEEQLAALYQRTLLEAMQIWVTTKIEPNSVSWSRFLKVDMGPLTGFQFDYQAGSFFIDEEKKVAVVFDVDGYKATKTGRYHTAFIVGDDGYFKSVSLGKAREEMDMFSGNMFTPPLVCSSSYRPSLVQIN